MLVSILRRLVDLLLTLIFLSKHYAKPMLIPKTRTHIELTINPNMMLT